MKNIKILVTEALGEEGLAILTKQAGFQVDLALNNSPEQLLDKIPNYNALLVRSQTQVDSKLINSGTNLEFIGRAGVGLDNIDIISAKNKNIYVTNTPTANSISTAELAFGLIISLARKIPQAHQHVSSGLWDRSKFKGMELFDKTLGIIGLGNVGKLLALRAQAFGMKILAHDPLIDQETCDKLNIEKLDLKNLLSKSNFISLHCALNSHTKNIINSDNLKYINKTAMIINTARGELIDNQALIKALNDGNLAGAALDVFVQEPPVSDDPVLKHPKILLTPHLGASTAEAQTRVANLLAEQTIKFFSGK